MSNNAQYRWSPTSKCVLDPILELLWAPKGLNLLKNGPLRARRRAQKVQKWVRDAYLENLGQLDHYMVFGTKSGAVQDLQRGKKCLLGVEWAPLMTHAHPT